jgi:hypothetical protein
MTTIRSPIYLSRIIKGSLGRGFSAGDSTIVARVVVRRTDLATTHTSSTLAALPGRGEEGRDRGGGFAGDPLTDCDAARVRGNRAWGHVTADFVSRLAVGKALDAGLALVSAVACNHIGYYVETAAVRDCTGILLSGDNAEELPTAAPYGRLNPSLAPNPLEVAFQAEDGRPSGGRLCDEGGIGWEDRAYKGKRHRDLV